MLRRCAVASMLIVASWAHAATGTYTGANTNAASGDPAPVGATDRVFHPAGPREWRGAQTRALVTRVWYPVDSDAHVLPHDIGPPGRAAFRGHDLAQNASLSTAHATYPLLVMSHGTTGSADDLDWLASALAAHGYIVAAVNHPGNNALEPLTREGFVLWWERARDLSDVLDGVLADPTFGPHIDRARIGAVGYSLGGYTVLELAGARTNLPAFKAFCHSHAADTNCHPPGTTRQAVAATPLPADALASIERAGASYRDSRVKAVLAIAPAIGKALDEPSLTRIDIPLRLIAGTADTTAPPPSNILHIARFLPHAQVDMIDGATHVSFINSCLPAVMTKLANICEEAPGVNRDEVHALAIEQAVTFFGASLTERNDALSQQPVNPDMPK
nr:hypothetical protein HUO10_003933 [Paraburkholderia busanensis]